jgi:hypothetical protein
MSRPLTGAEAAAALRRGKQIEQFLCISNESLLYLTASPRAELYVVRKHHVRDEGTDEFRDISEFSPVDDDEYIGEGAEVSAHQTCEDAVAEAERHGGAVATDG